MLETIIATVVGTVAEGGPEPESGALKKRGKRGTSVPA